MAGGGSIRAVSLCRRMTDLATILRESGKMKTHRLLRPPREAKLRIASALLRLNLRPVTYSLFHLQGEGFLL
jgi:hypothetical protein